MAARGALELGPAGREVNDRVNEEVEGPARGRADTGRLVPDICGVRPHEQLLRAILTSGHLCAPNSRY
jgi:hypothetical protein